MDRFPPLARFPLVNATPKKKRVPVEWCPPRPQPSLTATMFPSRGPHPEPPLVLLRRLFFCRSSNFLFSPNHPRFRAPFARRAEFVLGTLIPSPSRRYLFQSRGEIAPPPQTSWTECLYRDRLLPCRKSLLGTHVLLPPQLQKRAPEFSPPLM